MTQFPTFKTADFGRRYSRISEALVTLLETHTVDEIRAIGARLRRDLDSHQDRKLVSLAFVGQYSAGKTTIISGLSGRRDLNIDSDIATDECISMNWNTIEITDTPGLYTKRLDHDAKTNQAIRRSDLLAFCLTPMLFDDVTLPAFNRLAFHEGYADKLMIVINKMGDEAGNWDELEQIYREQLATSLGQENVERFNIVFIDALDYLEGTDGDDREIVDDSRFADLISSIDSFVKGRGQLARLDTPLRLLRGGITEAEAELVDDETGEKVFLQLLTKLSRRVQVSRDRLRTKLQSEGLNLARGVVDTGMDLAEKLGESENFDAEATSASKKVEELCERSSCITKELIEMAAGELAEEVSHVLGGELASSFQPTLEAGDRFVGEDVRIRGLSDQQREQWAALKNVGEKSGAFLFEAAEGKNLAGVLQAGGKGGKAAGAFLKAGNVAGGNLHGFVLESGKMIGFKFKPWQAVNIAKNVGNVAKFAGPALSAFGIALQIYDDVQDERQANALADARAEISGHFRATASQVERALGDYLSRTVEPELFGPIDTEIERHQTEHQSNQAKKSSTQTELQKALTEVDALLMEIKGGRMDR